MSMKSIQKWLSENVNLVLIALALAVLTWLFVYKPSQCGGKKEGWGEYPDALGKNLLDMKKYADKDSFSKTTDPTVILNGVSSSMIPNPAKPSDKWNELLPPDADLKDQQFLQPQEFIGVDTVAGTLRHANRDLRSAPQIPRVNVGPWNNSTIEYDPTGI